jgi:DNA-binding beta-propeller fold protein YncE
VWRSAAFPRRSAIYLGVILAVAAAACTTANPDYSDEQNECDPGRRCDYTRRVCEAFKDGSAEAGMDAGAVVSDFSGGSDSSDARNTTELDGRADGYDTDALTERDVGQREANQSIDSLVAAEDSAVPDATPPPDAVVCDPPSCDDEKACTDDECTAAGECSHTLKEGFCLIDERCYGNGEKHVTNPCRVCQATPETNTQWSWRRACVYTLAGSGISGHQDGPAMSARFKRPNAIALDTEGRVYVSDSENPRIRVIEDGSVRTLAGTGVPGYQDRPPGTEAQFRRPAGMLVDGSFVYIADDVDHRIRVLSGETVTTLAGTGTQGYVQGAFASAEFARPQYLAWLSSRKMLVGESGSIRLLDLDTQQVSLFAGTTELGFKDGHKTDAAKIATASSLAVDPSGTVYFTDHSNNRIRAVVGATVTTVAGTGEPGFTDGPAIDEAEFDFPTGLAKVGSTIYVVDGRNHAIRMIEEGQVSTLVGGLPGHVDGSFDKARFRSPTRISLGLRGERLYVGDGDNHCVRVIILP